MWSLNHRIHRGCLSSCKRFVRTVQKYQYRQNATMASSSSMRLPHTIANLLNAQDINDNISKQVTVSGWIRSVRKMKNVCFAAIGDGTTTLPLQAVMSPEQANGLNTGTSVQLSGEWKQSLNKTAQERELVVADIKVLGQADGMVEIVEYRLSIGIPS